MVYNLGSMLCNPPSDIASSVSTILATSTIVILPDIPHSQINCHDYGTVNPFQPVVNQVMEVIPEIDMVILIGTGGVKVLLYF